MKKLFALCLTLAMSVMSTAVFAEPAAGTGEAVNPLVSFLPFIVMIAAFYFILIRPQKKREKETRNMLNSLGTGDEVVTIGGIHGKIVKAKEDVVVLETGSDKVKITFERGAVSRVVKKNEKKSKEEKSEANQALEAEKAEIEKEKE